MCWSSSYKELSVDLPRDSQNYTTRKTLIGVGLFVADCFDAAVLL
jgi:hypothetical protein